MTLLDCEASTNGCRVTWSAADDNTEQTAEVELEWQPAECGAGPGWIATGDAPEAVLSYAAEWARERQRDQYEDALEQRADWRAEAGW